MTELHRKKCVPCRGGVPPLRGEAILKLNEELDGGWIVEKEHHLLKSFSFSNFRQALSFTNKVGEIAEDEGHHPDIQLSWGKVGIQIWTHKIGGLSESDFILAAKIDKLPLS